MRLVLAPAQPNHLHVRCASELRLPICQPKVEWDCASRMDRISALRSCSERLQIAGKVRAFALCCAAALGSLLVSYPCLHRIVLSDHRPGSTFAICGIPSVQLVIDIPQIRGRSATSRSPTATTRLACAQRISAAMHLCAQRRRLVPGPQRQWHLRPKDLRVLEAEGLDPPSFCMQSRRATTVPCPPGHMYIVSETAVYNCFHTETQIRGACRLCCAPGHLSPDKVYAAVAQGVEHILHMTRQGSLDHVLS